MKGYRVIVSKIVTALLSVMIIVLCFCGCSVPEPAAQSKWLRDVYADCFPIGAAVMTYSLTKFEEILPHFNSITAENDMKWRALEPSEGEYAYGTADGLVDWAKQHDTKVRGH